MYMNIHMYMYMYMHMSMLWTRLLYQEAPGPTKRPKEDGEKKETKRKPFFAST